MSLNDDVNKDLPEGGFDESNLAKPKVDNDSDLVNTIVVVKDQSENSEPSPEPSEEVIDKVSQTKIVFDIVSNDIRKVIDLKDVEDTLLNKKAVSQMDAEAIKQVFGETAPSPNSYTKAPTRIGLEELQTYVSNEVDKKEQDLDLSITNLTNKLKDLSPIIFEATEHGIAIVEMERHTESLKDKFAAIVNSKNLIYQVGKEFFNLLDIKCQYTDEGNEKGLSETVICSPKEFETLVRLFTVCPVELNTLAELLIIKNVIQEDFGKIPTIKDVLYGFNTTYLKEQINYCDSKLVSIKDELDNFLSAIPPGNNEDIEVINFFKDNTEKVNRIVTWIPALIKRTEDCLSFFNAVKNLINKIHELVVIDSK